MTNEYIGIAVTADDVLMGDIIVLENRLYEVVAVGPGLIKVWRVLEVCAPGERGGPTKTWHMECKRTVRVIGRARYD